MGYTRITKDEWQILSNYGYGWDVECIEFTLKEARQTIKEYRDNTNGQHRINKIRVKI